MTSDANALLQKALAAHRAGNLEAAEDGYRQVLKRVPEEPMALYLLGLTSFHRGDTQAAQELIMRSLQRAPRNVRAWKDLGGILMAAGRLKEARGAYTQAVEHGPQLAESWYNLGICLSKLGAPQEAITHLRRALAAEPGFTKTYEPLALLLYRSGDVAGAAQIYQQWLMQEPDSPRARHMAQAASAPDTSRPSRAADDYIRAHFDEAAAGFDTNLQQLHYRAPGLLAHALERLLPAPVAALLDAGCGTGLCGPKLRAQCTRLTGVDLSAGMLAHAAARGCYDELVEAELTAFMNDRPGSFDAVICADTLVYFGDLTAPLAAAHTTLRDRGVLLFTVEASNRAQPRLEIHGRYTHSEAYVRKVLLRARFTPLDITQETLREEREQPVAGLLVSARRA